MPRIPLTDSTGTTVDIDFDDKSDAARLGLTRLFSGASAFLAQFDEPLDKTSFRSALLGGDYRTPAIELTKAVGLTVKAGINTFIRVLRSAAETAVLELSSDAGEPWIEFGLETSVKVAASAGTASGFGVSGTQIAVHSVSTYTRIDPVHGSFPSLREAIQQAISNFRITRSAADLRQQPMNTISQADISGTFVLEGTYAYPFTVNAFALANNRLPLGARLTIEPAFELSLAGSLAVGGEFRARCYRLSTSKLQLALYKKQETDLSASFTAAAGLGTAVEHIDLLGALFRAIGNVDFDPAQIAEADRKLLAESLGAALDRGLSIALNLSCAAAHADEAAVLYKLDLSHNAAATDSAIDAALAGNWSAVAALPNAQTLRTLQVQTHETSFSATLHLLGIYDFATISDFVRQCRILHNVADGTVSITDRVTAQRIALAANPLAADDKKLRKVLEESFLATASYTAAGAMISAKQSLLIYKARESYSDLRKQLLLGGALGVLGASDFAQIPLAKEFKHFRLAAGATYEGDDALRLFFSDPAIRAARQEDDLKRLGRQVLVSVLNPADPADRRRIEVLQSDAVWAQMEQQRFPADSPASYSDWYDIVHWAHAIAVVGPKLNAVLEARSSTSGDPTQNAAFMRARDELAAALGEVTRNTHAAFEPAWPLAVMFALAERRVPVSFEAQWDGVKRFERCAARVLKAV